MKAYNCLECSANRELEVESADYYVKRVITDAKYMHCGKSYTSCLIPTAISKAEIEKGFEYTYYIINGLLYTNVLTSNHDELVKFYGEQSIEQLTFF